jgi:Tfp pilus assembly ATPase PilU
LDLTQSGQIQTVISKEEYYGMQTFERALFKLIEEGQTDYAEALQITSRLHSFRLMVQALGLGIKRWYNPKASLKNT